MDSFAELEAMASSAWRSERLVYEGVGDTEPEKKLIHELCNDPYVRTFADMRILAPSSNKASDEATKLMCEGKLINVWICLPAPVPVRHPDAPTLLEGDEPEAPPPKRIGMMSLTKPTLELAHEHRCSTFGIFLLRDSVGKGYGTEATRWILDFAFSTAGLHRVQLTVFGFNPRAMRCYEKVGFLQEGRERESIWLGRKWHDSYRYAILEQDWDALQEKRLKE